MMNDSTHLNSVPRETLGSEFKVLQPLSRGRRSAATRTGVSDCADLVPIKPKTTLALTVLSFTPCHPHLASVSSLSPFRLFLSAGAQVKNKNRPATAKKEKTMKLN